MKLISDTGIQILRTNGGRAQTVIFINDKQEKFKISIKSETHDFQSYAKLYKWSDSEGWLHIVTKNPKDFYGIKIAHVYPVNPKIFAPIINDLKKLSKNF